MFPDRIFHRRFSRTAAVVFCFLIILIAAWVAGKLALRSGPSADSGEPLLQVGQIENRAINESSGVVASRTQPGVLWTHNDSGSAPLFFAITREGGLLGRFRVATENEDWEDIAADEKGNLYIGDLGNNDLKRKELKVHRVREPELSGAGDTPSGSIEIAATWRLQFPGRGFDCESLFIHSGAGYVIDKAPTGKRARLFRFELPAEGGGVSLKELAVLPLKHRVTGADLTADGRFLAIVSDGGLFVFQMEQEEPLKVGEQILKSRLPRAQVEGVCFLPEEILVTAESGEIFVRSFR